MNNPSSIEAHRLRRIEQSERRATAFAAEQEWYKDDGTDGGQAVIDLALTGGYHLCPFVCNELAAAGYDVPEAVR